MSKKQKMTPVLPENGHETQENAAELSGYDQLMQQIDRLEKELEAVKRAEFVVGSQTLEIKASSFNATLIIKGGGQITNQAVEKALFEIGQNYRHMLFIVPKQEEQLAMLKSQAEVMKPVEENDGSAGANTVGGGGANTVQGGGADKDSGIKSK